MPQDDPFLRILNICAMDLCIFSDNIWVQTNNQSLFLQFDSSKRCQVMLQVQFDLLRGDLLISSTNAAN